jgi:PAS domain S-box-containing protein
MNSAGEVPPRASILLVDDRQENLIALQAILEPLGHELVTASSGKEALRQLLLNDFAVLLLDVQMPQMNGFELAQLIKSRERSRHIPIIFLTAISTGEEYVFEGYSAGAVDYLFKPFNSTILRSKVAAFVDLFLKGEELKRQAQLLRESERRELELRHRAELLESEARFSEIVARAMDAIVSFGDDRRVTLFNAAAERMFLCRAADALDQPVDRWLQNPLSLAVPSSSTEAERRPEPALPQEAIGVREDGEEFPIELTVSTLDVQSQPIHTVIIRDVSERRRAEHVLRAQALSLSDTTQKLRTLNEQLNQRTAELERAMGARSRFYASMSHELRTPINAVMGYTSLLLDNVYGPLTPEQANSIERTHKAANHLLDLVNDILDLSKMESGKTELMLEEVIFPELIRDLFITLEPLADRHHVQLRLEETDERCTIVSDARRVNQILLNLLSNAIKFGNGKPVEVEWAPAEDGSVVVQVTDHGPGIAPENQEKIFLEFVQLDDGYASEGTGLGLPISRRLALLLGGSLTVGSQVGHGSTFRLCLPASITEGTVRASESVPVNTEQGYQPVGD